MKCTLALALFTLSLSAAPVAHAGSHSFQTNEVSGNYSSNLDVFRAVSSTEVHYLKVGITQFEKGNYDKAERAFKAVLRADTRNAAAKQYLYVITELRKLEG